MRSQTIWHDHARPNPSHAYLWPAIRQVVEERTLLGRRALDLGCGSGATAQMLQAHGFDVIGIDQSKRGLSQARSAYPNVTFIEGSVYDDIGASHGRFDLVVNLEVIEHLYYPVRFSKNLHALLTEGGVCVLSTPYHDYLKNLGIAAMGCLDQHHNPAREHGHIKFFSTRMLEQVLRAGGFSTIGFKRVGRIPPLAKSLVAIAQ